MICSETSAFVLLTEDDKNLCEVEELDLGGGKGWKPGQSAWGKSLIEIIAMQT